MRTLSNHIILYDAECPMCRLYTGAFVRNGLLDSNGREAYQQYSGTACTNLDWQRAVNEIALVNQATGEVTYGVESLLKVCGNALPRLAPLFRWKPLLWVASKAYAFISYNRRVIVPAPASETPFHYQPSFNVRYRVAWLLFSWILTSCILASYTGVLTVFLTKSSYWREFTICGGQIFFQAAVIFSYKKEKAWDYLGNMMTVSLAGALALLHFLLLCVWLNLGWLACALFFLLTVFLMLLEHMRRCKLLGIGYLMTASWVLYRIVILVILFSLKP
ncbi:MAG: DUF393 domain-containing protein [Dyadobacter sp. 50-39]|uniref:DCC1-like thiol-disulfide oxidoreductase family protein n=1 Tax=Dyadobacter sp. 50-39 TaxID=1895756 RepID=UPI000965EAED|nr:DCC1-like thiol-disulfide oxidoreductase family protein [Dyadobacter sp. 50-39]OJV13041.1 MAG: DUF393 domain-containing protein [Dyadobacter sp. 50-39]